MSIGFDVTIKAVETHFLYTLENVKILNDQRKVEVVERVQFIFEDFAITDGENIVFIEIYKLTE